MKTHTHKNKAYLFNSIWMLFELTTKLLSVAIVSFVLARQLGAETFGTYSFITAIFTISLSISRLGMDATIVKLLAKNNDASKTTAICSTAFWIMLAGSVFTFLFTNIITAFFLEISYAEKILIICITLSLFFQPFLVIDYRLQSDAKAKLGSISKSASIFLCSILKILLAVLGAGLPPLILATLLEFSLIAYFLLLSAKKIHPQQFNPNKISSLTAKKILRHCTPLALSSIVLVINIRIDQVLIKLFLGDHSLGVYAAATKIYEAWINFPIILSISLLPMLGRLFKSDYSSYLHSITRFTRYLFWASITIAIAINILSKEIITFIFGADFIEGSDVLTISMWAAAFSALGSVTTRALNIENLEKLILTRSIACLLINTVLSIILIPKVGIIGAAYATLASVLASNFILDFFSPKMKDLRESKINAITFRPEAKRLLKRLTSRKM